MTFTQFNQRLRKYANGKSIENNLFKFLKQNPHLVMQYQMDQLFVQSVGADGIDLGRYSYNSAKYDKEKRGGTPFSMISTQDFFNRMYIKIGVVHRTIQIGSTTSHLDAMLSNKAFQTTNFFGIMKENEILLKTKLTKYVAEWIVNGLKNG